MYRIDRPLKNRALKKRALDKDLKQVSRIERTGRLAAGRLIPLSFALLFLLLVWILVAQYVAEGTGTVMIIAAAVVGGYMALNIGANDVANNMGPAVGARALTMGGALAMAAVCEAAGALLAGGDVVQTVSKGIIDPAILGSSATLMTAMLAALLAAALWINIATVLAAPVSTTHSVVGGVLGAGLAAAGTGVVNWPVLGAIVASWVVSPLMGALIAALFLALIHFLILRAEQRMQAALRWIPLLLGVTAAVFAAYLMMKGLSRVWRPPFWTVLAISAGVFAVAALAVRPALARRIPHLDDSRKSVGQLFSIPLVVAAALLSFAHGANDVANAVGPLAAIVAAASGQAEETVAVPGWIMLVGAVGIAAGLALFGPKLIRTVGEKITRLNPTRAFCVALSAAITVLAASALGLPVSSTHIAVGGIFGVGFLREFHANRRGNRRHRKLGLLPDPNETEEADAALMGSPGGGNPGGGEDLLPRRDEGLLPRENENLLPDAMARQIEKAKKRKLVRRRYLLSIAAAWVITVPLSAILGAVLFLGLATLM